MRQRMIEKIQQINNLWNQWEGCAGRIRVMISAKKM
jgi:hypothetical protein